MNNTEELEVEREELIELQKMIEEVIELDAYQRRFNDEQQAEYLQHISKLNEYSTKKTINLARFHLSSARRMLESARDFTL